MEWHKIEDGYPEHLKEVLIAVEYCETPIQSYWHSEDKVWVGSREIRDWMKDGFVNDATLIIGGIGAKVTHWIELPEIPQNPK